MQVLVILTNLINSYKMIKIKKRRNHKLLTRRVKWQEKVNIKR